jgi:RNA polymerase sigma-70 factor (ECF subfamily)
MAGHSLVVWGWNPSKMTRDRSDADADARTSAPLGEADDRTLVAAFLAGRHEAFDVIVERHRRNVYQICYRFVGNHEDAADLSQDVFVRAYKGLRKFKGDASLGTWLYRVSVNASLNRLAVKRPVAQPIEAAQHVDGRGEDALNQVLREERAEQVRAAIKHLPPKQRATLMLRVYQDLTHEEISKILGSSVGAVKANFFHALNNLKRLLERR